MPTIGYGEDGLTFHALHARRAKLLELLGDDTPPEQCLVYFRPSFGRAGGFKSAQFGEFDAIFCTNTFIYLIESKWNSGDGSQVIAVLPEVQRLRHLIFAWYYKNWCEVFPHDVEPTWTAFLQARDHAFGGRPIAPLGSLLARNLESILSKITRPARPLRNVLLYFQVQGQPAATRIVTPTLEPVHDPVFDLITLPYAPIGVSRYFEMAD